METRKICTRDDVNLHASIREVGAKNWIIIVHGIGEHSARHHYLNKVFFDFNICYFDLRGHGLSEGRKSFVEDFDNFYDDLEDVIKFLREQYKMPRYCLMGHSMGGLIVAGFIQRKYARDEVESYPQCVFLSAPAAGLPGLQGKLVRYLPHKLTSFLANFSVSVPLSGLVDLNTLSHDGLVAIDYKNDPLNQLKLESRLVLNLIHASKDVFSRPLRVKCPLFCAVGSEDRVVDPVYIQQYFTEIEKGSVFECIHEGFHELHNEVERYRIPYLRFLEKSIRSCV